MHPVALLPCCSLLDAVASGCGWQLDSLGWPQQCQVNCLLQPQATITGTHCLLNTHWVRQSESQEPHLSPDHLFHCFTVCRCFCYQVCPHKTIYIPPPSLLLWGLNLMSVSWPPSKCCGPYWFLSVHLYHSLSLVAGQTVVTERRGCVVTVGINRPEVRNAVNQETARRLLEELEAFDSDPDLNVAVLHGKGKRSFLLIDPGRFLQTYRRVSACLNTCRCFFCLLPSFSKSLASKERFEFMGIILSCRLRWEV